jgi:3',5'-cyclic-AMP phosphodiesterase
MLSMDRRRFLSFAAMTAGAMVAGASPLLAASEAPSSFDYLFITDTHIQPELAAAHGCRRAFRKAAAMRVDFAIQGGDHVFDALAVDRERANTLFDLYTQTEQSLGLKVHHTIGNHDHFGLFAKSGVPANSLGYGKQMYRERVGPTYYSFNHKGYHFIVLDTIQPTQARSWEARIDAAQIEWLRTDLSKVAAGAPVIVTTHVPLVTGFASYAPPGSKGSAITTPLAHPQLVVINAHEVLPLLEKHNVLAVFQGHTHINEVVSFRGIQYITSGAVCGNWWHGTHLGTPEGFTVVSLRNGKLTHRYETYGFRTVEPQNT